MQEQKSLFMRGVGLAGNDVAAFYPLLAFLGCAVYLSNNKRKVIGDYFQSEEEYEQSHDVKVVAQMGLRFATQIADQVGVFNEATPEEKDEREAAFIRFMRQAVNQKDRMKADTEIVSQAARSEMDELPRQEPGVHNTDCERDFPQTSWWKAKYTFEPFMDYLPMSFLLEGTARNGSRVRLFGPLKLLRVEADRDVTTPVPQDSTTWKMYMEIEDTNWTQQGGVEGTTFRFVCSQQADKCVFSALVDEYGKPLDVFVSVFALHLLDHPVGGREDVVSGFLEAAGHGSSNKPPLGAIATFSVHPSRDLLLSYLVRALPEIDATIVFSKDNDTVLVGGATANTPLPLEVHLESVEPLNDAGDRFLALPVYRVMVRYMNPQPPKPGELDPRPATVKSVQFLLENGSILAQDAVRKTVWVVGEQTLHTSTTIDLVALNKTPTPGGKPRQPGRSGGAVPSEVNGVIKFTQFPGVRQGFNLVSIDKDEQDRHRGDPLDTTSSYVAMLTGKGARSQAWDDIRVNDAIMSSRVPTLREVYGNSRVSAILVGLVVALGVGWRVATADTVANIGHVGAGVSLLAGLGAFILALAEYTDRLPEELRPYEPVLYVVACTGIAAAMAVNLIASRCVPETSPAFTMSTILAGLAAVGILALESHSEIQPSPPVLALKLSLLLIMGTSLGLLAMELNKTARKAAECREAPPLQSTVAQLPNLAGLLTLAVAVGTVVILGTIEWTTPSDACDEPIHQRNKLANRLMDVPEDGSPLRIYLEDEQRRNENRASSCEAVRKFPFYRLEVFSSNTSRLSDFAPLFLMAPCVLMWMVSPVVGRFVGKVSPSRVTAETGQTDPVRLEDGRTPRGWWILKSLLGLLLVFVVVQLFIEETEGADPYCSHLREMEQLNRESVMAAPLESGTRMKQVYQSEWRYGCQPLVTRSFWLVVAGASLVGILSLVSPARKRFAPSRASAFAVLCRFALFFALAGPLSWVYLGTNRTKVLGWF